jgi:hypothetical protein
MRAMRQEQPKQCEIHIDYEPPTPNKIATERVKLPKPGNVVVDACIWCAKRIREAN